MDKQAVIKALNKAIALEHTASLQYQQHSLLVRGFWRTTYAAFFSAASDEAHLHANQFGQKVVALGGIPTVDVEPIRQSTDLEEMLRQNLDTERAACAAYQEALEAAQDDVALRNMLEDQIQAEQSDIEELELQLDMVTSAEADGVSRLGKVARV